MSDLVYDHLGFLFFSIIYRDDKIFHEFKQRFSQRYLFEEEYCPQFNPSLDYYSKEMGEQLRRCLIFTEKKENSVFVIEVKKEMDRYEKELKQNGVRTINIDPGVMSLSQVFLTTGKPYSHRIYLGQGVYAELNYTYQNGSFQSLPWTYPDYANTEKIELFNRKRKQLF